MTPHAVQCRFCRCTHELPCVLPNGDECMLSLATSLCSNPRCILAGLAEAKVIAKRRREEVAARVRPVLESFRREWARKRVKKRRPGKQQTKFNATNKSFKGRPA